MKRNIRIVIVVVAVIVLALLLGYYAQQPATNERQHNPLGHACRHDGRGRRRCSHNRTRAHREQRREHCGPSTGNA